jgi:hypothetical protein
VAGLRVRNRVQSLSTELIPLIVSSKLNRTPHTLIAIAPGDFREDLKYDVELELELVRPPRGHEEMGQS